MYCIVLVVDLVQAKIIIMMLYIYMVFKVYV